MSRKEAQSRQSPSTAQNPDRSIWYNASAQVRAGRNRISSPTVLPTYVSIVQAVRAGYSTERNKCTTVLPTYAPIGQGRKEN